MRRAQALAGLAALVSGVVVMLAPAAHAQTGYPPGVCTAITGTSDVGAVTVGQRFVLQLAPTCLFTPGAAITVTVNGVNIPGKVAEPGGSCSSTSPCSRPPSCRSTTPFWSPPCAA